MSLVLSASELYKCYHLPHKTLDVLLGASLEAHEGELLAIIGRSGSGKSTLLNLLGGIDRPDKGDVFLNGENLFSMSSKKRTEMRASNIGFIFQAYHLLPEMTILENVMVAGMARLSYSKRELRQRALEFLSFVELEKRALHRPQELSGGEQQRAAIARALMNSPRLLLADEPTGNLDSATGAMVLDMLFGLVRKSKSAMIIVTHDLSVAKRCDRIIELKDGKFTPKTDD